MRIWYTYIINCLHEAECQFALWLFFRSSLKSRSFPLTSRTQTSHGLLLHICDCLLLYTLISSFLKKVFFYWFSDPRVNDWAMMSSPFPTVAICLSYAYFSKVLGPKLMENRKPFDLRGILIMYNLIQTIFSAWIFYEVCLFFFFSYFYII